MFSKCETWLHQELAKSKIAAGLAWAKENPTQTSYLDALETDLRQRWEAEHGESPDD